MTAFFRAAVWVAVTFPLWAGCSDDPPTVQTPEMPAQENPKKPPQKPSEPNSEDVPGRIERIGDALSALLECPTKIWDDASWHDRPVLFVSVSARRAFLWNDQKLQVRSIHEVDFAGLPEGALTSYFDRVDYQGSSTIAISLDTTEMLNRIAATYTDVAATFAIHEGFHIWHQASWPIDHDPGAVEASTRDPDYPDDYRLRYLRARVLASLRASAESGAPLGVAAHWQNTLRTEYPRELNAMLLMDVLEGSAQYATTVAEILGQLGCDASPDAIVAEVRRREDAFVHSELRAGGEFYDIGLMAGLVLRKKGGASFGSRVEGGETMVDVLLEGVVPIAEPDDPGALALAKDTIEDRNAEAALWIEPLLARFDDPAATRLALPTPWVSGGISIGDGFFVIGRPDRAHVIQDFSASLVDPRSKVAIQPRKLGVLFDYESPCAEGKSVLTIPLAPGSVEVDASGKASSTRTELVMTGLPVTRKVDDRGLTWLCPVGGP